jgi:hypothetical protein
VRIVIGAAAVAAAALGVSAFLIADQPTKKQPSTTTLIRASAPALADGVANADALASGSVAARPRVSESSPSMSDEVRKQIMSARAKAAKDGVKVTRPLPQPRRPVVGLTRTTVGTLDTGGIVRLVTAQSDLTGQEELSWVAGGVSRYRDASCSQTFRFSPNTKPAKRPNMLLCWRTSAKKSVVAIEVAPRGTPSKPKAIAELDKKWRDMK